MWCVVRMVVGEGRNREGDDEGIEDGRYMRRCPVGPRWLCIRLPDGYCRLPSRGEGPGEFRLFEPGIGQRKDTVDGPQRRSSFR